MDCAIFAFDLQKTEGIITNERVSAQENEPIPHAGFVGKSSRRSDQLRLLKYFSGVKYT